MALVLPEYNLPPLSGDIIHQLGQFEDILQGARDNGLVNVVPDSEQETYNFDNQIIRLRTVTSRLWLLGYLDRKLAPEELETNKASIERAVRQFQHEANLTVDNWVGDQTWNALDQLVSFESELHTPQWFDGDEIRPEVSLAIHRATQLRLFCLGLYTSKPNREGKILQAKELSDFAKIASMFRIPLIPENIGMNHQTLRKLFDQDTLTKRIYLRASTDKTKFKLNLPSKKQKQHERLGKKFIVNCAKIELWLLGFEVDIDGKGVFKASKNNQLYTVVVDYFKKFEGKNTKEAELLAKDITPSLFEGIAEKQEVSTSYNEDDASIFIADQFKENLNVSDAWEYIKSRGMRLWDGLKRVWRWMVNKGKQVVSLLKQNLYKGLFRYASKAFKIIGKGIGRVTASIMTYMKGEMRSEHAVLYFSKDMDTTVFLSPQITVDQCYELSATINRQSRAFAIGTQIIEWVIRMFKDLAKGVVGWALLLLTLVRSYNQLRILYAEFKALALEELN